MTDKKCERNAVIGVFLQALIIFKIQKKHHQKISFKEELISLLKQFGIDYDEKYLWD